jgi:hypothetical protein
MSGLSQLVERKLKLRIIFVTYTQRFGKLCRLKRLIIAALQEFDYSLLENFRHFKVKKTKNLKRKSSGEIPESTGFGLVRRRRITPQSYNAMPFLF